MRTSNIKTKTVLKADSDDYVNVKKSRAEKDFDNIIEKCKANGWLNVIDFLRDKATNSIKTAIGYWTGISHLDDFIQRQYDHGYDAQTIIEPLKQERIDIYDLLRLFKQYMIYEYPKISKNQITVGSVINYIKSAKSYFMFSDIDIIEHKFKQRVKMPRLDKEDEQAIDTND